MSSRLAGAALVAALLVATAATGAPARKADKGQVQAFVGARILPISGEPIDDGVLLVRGARILAVGPASRLRVPKDAVIHDVAGKVLMPGLIDTHSHVGGGWGADGSAPIQPDVRVMDSIDCRNPGFQRGQAGGITTANIMPGSGHLMSGQTAYVKFKDANSIEELLVRGAKGEPLGGMKMANGTNSQKDAPFPGTRSKSAALVREQFVKAQAYQAKLAKGAQDPSKRPDRDLGLEALVEVLEGRRVVHHHTHRHDDILTVLRLAQEFGFRVVLHHVSEAWKVADEIAAAKAPCSIIVLDSPGGKLEARDIDSKNGAVLEQAGVLVAFHTDDWITDSRLFFRSAALAVRSGMSRKGALEALTINGAKMLDLDGRIGSLESDKDADFIILSGDPLSTYTHVLETWIEGERVFNREDPQDRLWADGGWGAGEPRNVHLCCYGGWEPVPVTAAAALGAPAGWMQGAGDEGDAPPSARSRNAADAPPPPQPFGRRHLQAQAASLVVAGGSNTVVLLSPCLRLQLPSARLPGVIGTGSAESPR